MRCFLGLPLPPECRIALKNAWNVPKTERDNLRLTDPGLWHTTLAFFGEIEYDNLLKLVDLIGRALETPPEGLWHLSSIQTFPRKHPIMYVAPCQLEQELAWRTCIAQVIDMTSLLAPQIDRKPWVPHITLARTKNRETLVPVDTAIADISWTPDHATLFQSEHTLSGPRYTPLHEYRLKTER